MGYRGEFMLLKDCSACYSCVSIPVRFSTYRWIVTPLLRRSLTRSTLLIMSLPRLSNTRTFQTGSPFSVRRESIWYCAAAESLLDPSFVARSWFKPNILSIDAMTGQYPEHTFRRRDKPIWRSRSVCVREAMLRVWTSTVERRLENRLIAHKTSRITQPLHRIGSHTCSHLIVVPGNSGMPKRRR